MMLKLKKGDTATIQNKSGAEKILCEVKDIKAYFTVDFTNEKEPIEVTTVKYDVEVVQNKPGRFNGLPCGYKRDELKGMVYSMGYGRWGDLSLLPCSEFIFNQKTFEICIDKDGKPCKDGNNIDKVVFVKAKKIFTVNGVDYFVYNYKLPAKSGVGSGYARYNEYYYGIAEYMTGLTVSSSYNLKYTALGIDTLFSQNEDNITEDLKEIEATKEIEVAF